MFTKRFGFFVACVLSLTSGACAQQGRQVNRAWPFSVQRVEQLKRTDCENCISVPAVKVPVGQLGQPTGNYVTRAEFEAKEAQLQTLLDELRTTRQTETREAGLIGRVGARVADVELSSLGQLREVRSEFKDIRQKLDDDTPRYILLAILALLIVKMGLQMQGGLKANVAAAGIERVKDIIVARHISDDAEKVATQAAAKVKE